MPSPKLPCCCGLFSERLLWFAKTRRKGGLQRGKEEIKEQIKIIDKIRGKEEGEKRRKDKIKYVVL